MNKIERQEMKNKTERHPTDHYETPAKIAEWGIDRCLELTKQYCGKVQPSSLKMLEPGCGLMHPFSRRAIALGIESYGVDVMDVDADE